MPKSTANSMHLFSSQPCENVFRDARALSGIYSTRINFTIKQFLQRINKLNAVMELRQFESTNIYEKIMFPVHHKIRQIANEIDFCDMDEDDDFNCNNVEEIIGQAYEAAQQTATFAGMDKDLIKFNLFNMKESSKMAEKLLKFNTLTETEMIILGDRSCEDSDEDAFDRVEDDEEEDFIEDEKKDCVQDEDLIEDDKENSFKEDTVGEVDHLQDGNVEDCVDEDVDEGLNENVYDYYSFENDLPSTSSFENLKATSDSGIH